MVQWLHAVEQVRDVPHAPLRCGHHLLPRGPGMPGRKHHSPLQRTVHNGRRAGEFRSQSQEPHDARLEHVAQFVKGRGAHVAAVLRTEPAGVQPGALDVSTEDCRAAGALAHGPGDVPQRGQHIGMGRRHGSGQEARHPMARVEGGYGAERLRGGVHGVHPEGAVRMQVDEARRQGVACQVDGQCVAGRRGIIRAERLDAVALRAQPAGRENAIASVQGPTVEQHGRHHAPPAVQASRSRVQKRAYAVSQSSRARGA